jgi:hypothetical protein
MQPILLLLLLLAVSLCLATDPKSTQSIPITTRENNERLANNLRRRTSIAVIEGDSDSDSDNDERYGVVESLRSVKSKVRDYRTLHTNDNDNDGGGGNGELERGVVVESPRNVGSKAERARFKEYWTANNFTRMQSARVRFPRHVRSTPPYYDAYHDDTGSSGSTGRTGTSQSGMVCFLIVFVVL